MKCLCCKSELDKSKAKVNRLTEGEPEHGIPPAVDLTLECQRCGRKFNAVAPVDLCVELA